MNKNRLTVSQNITIENALKVLNLSGSKTLLVMGKSKKVLGTLSDGDLRRAILKNNGNLTQKISGIYNDKFFSFSSKDVKKSKLTEAFVKFKYDIIPIIDDEEKLVDLVSWEQVFAKEKSLKKRK